jgi:hypothetical protein
VITAPFDYEAPDSLEGAIRMLHESGEDAKALAGGHSLLPLMKVRLAAPTLLVDRVAHFVIDTSRNGLGPDPGGEWCNPPGRALGQVPGTATDYRLDWNLWIKRPGESDVTCNGGPRAGAFWTSYAVGLAQRGRTGSTTPATTATSSPRPSR